MQINKNGNIQKRKVDEKKTKQYGSIVCTMCCLFLKGFKLVGMYCY